MYFFTITYETKLKDVFKEGLRFLTLLILNSNENQVLDLLKKCNIMNKFHQIEKQDEFMDDELIDSGSNIIYLKLINACYTFQYDTELI